ncbi:MAG: hypothetical protein H5T64_12015 [Chloroflexi bacterium]|nr:hypothetical protein [Chloroflexota bacterium]
MACTIRYCKVATLIVLLLLAGCTPTPTPVATPTSLPTPTLTATPTPTIGIKALPPVIFVMNDWINGDWGNPNWQRQNFVGIPQVGALGGWTSFSWRDLNPEKGVYDWTKTDDYILFAQSMTVTLPDGTVIPKPVGLMINTWDLIEKEDSYGQNYTPTWVGEEMGRPISDCLDPDGPGPCKPFCTPPFADPTWQYWFDQFVLEMGRHYDKNPQFSNLAFVLIATGVDGETAQRKNLGACKYHQSGNEPAFEEWVLHLMETYNTAFPHTPHFIQPTLHLIPQVAEKAVSLPNPTTGVKVNGMMVDHPNAESYLDGVLVGGVTGFADLYHGHILVGFEPAGAIGTAQDSAYWFYMEALSHHPDILDIQLVNIFQGYDAEQVTGFPLLDFVRTHLGVSPQDTPSVWTVLRETTLGDVVWMGSDGKVHRVGPHRGDLAFWLYRRGDIPGNQAVALTGEEGRAQIPAPARNHPYAWHSARRTDQGSGNPYMSFDVDDATALAFAEPAASGGAAIYTVTVTFVNQGTDTLALEYKNRAGLDVVRTVVKGSDLGPADSWVDYTWTLADAYFGNGMPGGADFRLNCNGDGDEIVHRVIVRRVE